MKDPASLALALELQYMVDCIAGSALKKPDPLRGKARVEVEDLLKGQVEVPFEARPNIRPQPCHKY